MLGIRLDEETERGLTAIARRTKRPKSQIAREAIRAYVARNDLDARAKEQWQAISDAERDNAETNELLDSALRDLDRDA